MSGLLQQWSRFRCHMKGEAGGFRKPPSLVLSLYGKLPQNLQIFVQFCTRKLHINHKAIQMQSVADTAGFISAF